MRRESKFFVTLTLALAMVCILGCGNKLTVNAVNKVPDENIVVEFSPDTQEQSKEYVEETVKGNHIQWWQDEWKTEYITNSEGKEIRLHYLAAIVWTESEEETLAKFLRCEGGNYEEKTRIAQLVSWRKYDAGYADTIQDVLKTDSYFAIRPEFWNEFAEPTEEDYKIAKAALECTEKPEYVHCIFREFYEEKFEQNELNTEVYKTENYVFFN